MGEHNNITQHSTSSYIGVDYDEVRVYRVMYVKELQAESDRRLALLRRIEADEDLEYCPICERNLYADLRDKSLMGHANGCELDAECNG